MTSNDTDIRRVSKKLNLSDTRYTSNRIKTIRDGEEQNINDKSYINNNNVQQRGNITTDDSQLIQSTTNTTSTNSEEHLIVQPIRGGSRREAEYNIQPPLSIEKQEPDNDEPEPIDNIQEEIKEVKHKGKKHKDKHVSFEPEQMAISDGEELHISNLSKNAQKKISTRTIKEEKQKPQEEKEDNTLIYGLGGLAIGVSAIGLFLSKK